MEVKINDIKIDEVALAPTLTIDLYLEFGYYIEAPISVTGRLLTADGKVISFLNEYKVNSDCNYGLRLLTKEQKENTRYGKKDFNRYYAQMTAILSPKAIEHIELQREKDNEKRVMLRFDFVIKYLELSADTKINTDGNFLELQIKPKQCNFEISQSDWIYKYSSQLGIGKFLLLELQIPDDRKVADLWVDLYKRLALRLKEMEEAIRQGDWQKTIETSRKFFDALKIGDGKDAHKKFDEELHKLFIKDHYSNSSLNS